MKGRYRNGIRGAVRPVIVIFFFFFASWILSSFSSSPRKQETFLAVCGLKQPAQKKSKEKRQPTHGTNNEVANR